MLDKRILRTAVVASLITLLTSTQTFADNGVQPLPGGGGFGVTATASSDSPAPEVPITGSVDDQAPQFTYITETACAIGGAQTCGETQQCTNGETQVVTYQVSSDGTQQAVGDNCPKLGEPEVQSEPQLTIAMVSEAFRRVPVPSSRVLIEPPNAVTLVNFETNFYTETSQFIRTVRILGRRVDLRIAPVRFDWRFGDGDGLRSAGPGAPFPDLQVTHAYARRSTVRVAVDTTYSASYRVNGGSWNPVPETVRIAGNGEPLTIIEASPTLVGYERGASTR